MSKATKKSFLELAVAAQAERIRELERENRNLKSKLEEK